MSKQKAVIKLGVPNAKNRSKAMQLASKSFGVNSVAITGDARDRLEVVGEGVDTACLVNRLRKKVCSADIVVVEEVKDKKEEVEKKEAEAKKKAEEDKKKEEEANRRRLIPAVITAGRCPRLYARNNQQAATSCERT